MKHVRISLAGLVVFMLLFLAGCGGGGEAAPDAGEAGDAGAAGAQTDMVVITQDSVDTVVEMVKGKQAVLQLDPAYNWSVAVTPALVASVVKDAVLAEGQTAILEAKLPGSAVIQVTGKPVCATDNPPCETPQEQLTIKIKVSAQ